MSEPFIVFGEHKSHTGRGDFEDAYGQKCMLAPSSSVEPSVWFGPYDKGASLSNIGPMHLRQSQVKALLPYLIAFAETGDMNIGPEQVKATERGLARLALQEQLEQAATELEDQGYGRLAEALRVLADPAPDSEMG